MHGDQRERVRSSTAKLPLPTRLAPVNAAAAAVARGKEQRRHAQKAGLVSVYASKGLPMPSPTSYHGAPSGLLVLLRRRRRDVLADLLGDVRREHAVVPRAAQVEREDEPREREEQVHVDVRHAQRRRHEGQVCFWLESPRTWLYRWDPPAASRRLRGRFSFGAKRA